MPQDFTIDEALQIALQFYSHGNYPDAQAVCNQIIDHAGQIPDAWNILGLSELALDHKEKALTAFEEAIHLMPENASYRINQGEALRKIEKFDESEAAFLQALKLDPKNPDICFNLGNLHHQTNQNELAIQRFQQAIGINPTDWEYHYNLANTYRDAKYMESALFHYHQAMKLNPSHTAIHNNAALLLHQSRRYVDAEALYVKASKLDPRDPSVAFNRANNFKTMLQYAQAETEYQRALELDPDFLPAKINLAFTHLSQQKFELGWSGYEARHLLQQEYREIITPVESADQLKSKKILLLNEQGYGDTIMFARFLPQLQDQTETLKFLPQKELQSLFSHHWGDTIVESIEEDHGFDAILPIGSLPRIFDVRDSRAIPANPYLQDDSKLTEKYRQEFFDHDELKIGLCWQGNPEFSLAEAKAVALKLFQPLFELENTRYYSLQKNPSVDPRDFGLTDLDPAMESFLDTASLLQNLDILITIDTAVAHLAGAMGKKALVLLPKECDWRWGDMGSESYWYPTFKLFREEDGFKPVIQEILTVLKNLQKQS